MKCASFRLLLALAACVALVVTCCFSTCRMGGRRVTPRAAYASAAAAPIRGSFAVAASYSAELVENCGAGAGPPGLCSSGRAGGWLPYGWMCGGIGWCSCGWCTKADDFRPL